MIIQQLGSVAFSWIACGRRGDGRRDSSNAIQVAILPIARRAVGCCPSRKYILEFGMGTSAGKVRIWIGRIAGGRHGRGGCLRRRLCSCCSKDEPEKAFIPRSAWARAGRDEQESEQAEQEDGDKFSHALNCSNFFSNCNRRSACASNFAPSSRNAPVCSIVRRLILTKWWPSRLKVTSFNSSNRPRFSRSHFPKPRRSGSSLRVTCAANVLSKSMSFSRSKFVHAVPTS